MSCKTEELSIELLERVLAKLGLSSRPAPTSMAANALCCVVSESAVR